MSLIKDKVLEYSPDILENLRMLVSYPSVYAEDGGPFGKANLECLHAALELGRRYGFKAESVDDYAGYIEMGQGDEVIGIVAHLDVVPVSDTWKTDPFVMTQIGDRYYGRGTSDDKGGVVCGLQAMKILSEIKPNINKRIRLIMGCNEESGSACIRHYVEKEGAVDCGFTPDGSFPVVFGEKGMAHGLFHGKSDKILDIKGGTAPNAVCARVTLKLVKDCFDQAKLADWFDKNGQGSWQYDEETGTLTVIGQAAHASTPEEGINAISLAMESLYAAGIDDELVSAYHKLIGVGYYGEGIGLGLHDEYGRLTFNVGMAFKKDGELCFTIDIRFPVTMKAEKIVPLLQENGQGWVAHAGGVDPLFFPLDHPMIKAMLDAYYKVTGSDLQPLTMGGGTYARSMPNIVAFGCDTQQYNWHIHDDNEFVTLESLQTQTEVYTEALLNLLEI